MKKILVLDIETTGFLKQGGSIVEIGISELNLENGEVNIIYDSLCREEMLDESHASGKFGWIFQNSDLTLEEVLEAPAFEQVKEEVQTILDEYPLGVTAYNKNFDFGYLRDRGLKINDLPCPMLLSTPVCKIPGRYNKPKWPKVEEAFDFFFPDNEYVEAHRGADDSKHEAMIVYELFKMGIFEVPGYEQENNTNLQIDGDQKVNGNG